MNTYTTSNIKKIKWGFLEENNPVSLYPCMYPGWCGIIETTGKILGRPQRNIINLHRKECGTIFIDHKEWTMLGEYALKKTLDNPEWALQLNWKILFLSDELTKFSTNKIFRADLKGKNPRQLYSLYKTYVDRHNALYSHAIIPVYLDFYKPHLTTCLLEYLDKQVKETGCRRTARECFALLTIPEKLSKVQEEEKFLLDLAIKLRGHLKEGKLVKNFIPQKLLSAVKKHAEKFRYLGYNFEGPAFTDDYFWERLNEMIKDAVKPEAKLRSIASEKKKALRESDALVRILKIDRRHRKLLEITKGFIYSKDYRKMSLVQAYYEVGPLLSELAERFDLTLPQIRNCLLPEIKEMSRGGRKPKDLFARMEGFFFVVLARALPGEVITDARFEEMRKYLLKKEDLKEVNFFHGQTASLGKAQGRVKIINGKKDLKKMRPGDILVTQMTNPDLVPAMKKAAAIVTDLGGITCHAAIVSRELKKPCVIGTKIATRVLKDGDLIEVDANNATIKRI